MNYKSHPDQKAIVASGFAETDDVKEAQKYKRVSKSNYG
jgi:hypothetical protein